MCIYLCPACGPSDHYVAIPGSVLPYCPRCRVRLVKQVELRPEGEAF